jgi:hypothetical protein
VIDEGESAPTVAHTAARSAGLRRLAAVGLAGYGLIHLLVAWLVLQLAWGERGSASDPGADPSGALAVLAGSEVGRVLLWLLAGGLAGLTVWQAVEVLRSRRSLTGPAAGRRAALLLLARTLGTAVVYGWLPLATARAALSGGQQRDDEQRSVRGVLALPGGQLLVLAAGLVIIGIGGYQVRKGWRAAFRNELDLTAVPQRLRRLTVRLCQAGFLAKGIAFVLVGAVVGGAAVTFDAERATGLDGALRAVVLTPFGPWLLTGIALGLATFSIYCFTRARHPVS